MWEDATYKTERLLLEPGDSLFIYTDGVTEAMNERKELFSKERLKDEIIALGGKSGQELIAGVMQSIKRFSQGAPQSDDYYYDRLRI